MAEYPRIEEHVGNRAASPAGELGTRAESAVEPADAALLELLADAYDPAAADPDEGRLAVLGRDLETGLVSARLRALANTLREITHADAGWLETMARDIDSGEQRAYDSDAVCLHAIAAKLTALLPSR